MRANVLSDIDIVTLIKAAYVYMRERGRCARGVWLVYTSTRCFVLIAEVFRSGAKTKEAHELGHVLYVEAQESESDVADYVFVEAYTLPVIERFKCRIKIA